MRPPHALAILSLAASTDAVLGGDDRPDDAPGLACPSPAELWLSTGAAFENAGNGEVTFIVSTSSCGQMMTFASGTSQADIIQILNAFPCLGLNAEQDPTNPARVRVATIATGLHQFVCVQQIGAEDPGFLFESADAPEGDTALCDIGNGGFYGDLDCDAEIGPSDLAILLGAWGSTSHEADMNGSGLVDAEDLSILLSLWGA
ncbi:MAG: hypothetical protein JNL80_15860 [Phycisphaerae bacterium]|jgi:hypothetical protein|nr:hypothetical protein [Phycisphaerae bacterium]